MEISENDLKRRLLTAQIEILNEVVSDLRKKKEWALMQSYPEVVRQMRDLKIEYSKYLTTLTRERENLKQEK